MLGLIEKAEAEIDLTHGIHQRGLDLRLTRQLAFDPAGGAVEDFARLELFALGAVRIRSFENLDEEIERLFRLVAFGADLPGLHHQGADKTE